MSFRPACFAGSIAREWRGNRSAKTASSMGFQAIRNEESGTVAVGFVTEWMTLFRRRRFWLEWLGLIVLLLLFFGQRPPDVNETHYLTKAKHFWNPDWCPGDLFLSSAYSHWLFYVSTGWVTRWVSLETYALMGRLVCFALFTLGWWRLAEALRFGYGRTVLGIVFFVVLVDRFSMAGEWAIGGFEAKSLAYGFVLLSLDAWVRRQSDAMLVALGLATAYHVLVGGWSLVALMGMLVVWDVLVN